MAFRAFTPSTIFVLSTVAAISASPRHQPQSPTSPGASPSIVLDAVVSDANGVPVRGLGPGDFDVLEDGRTQPVQSVTVVDLPLDIPAATTAARQPAVAVEGRRYILAIDTFHLTPAGAHRVATILRQFIEQYLGPADRAALIDLGNPTRNAPFTSDRNVLLHAAGAASSSSFTSTAQHRTLGPGPFLGASDTALANEAMFERLAGMIRRSRPDPRRRVAVLLVTDGIDTDIYASTQASRDTLEAQKDLFAAAARANVNVYPVDPRGMGAMNSSLDPGPGNRPLGVREWESLRTIAATTGGRAILGHLDLAPSYLQIVRDNSTYYLIAYQSPHAADRDGRFHEVEVRVRTPGVDVSTRKGWYATEEKGGPALE